MRAVRIHSPGPPEVLVYEDAPTPSPRPGEVLVRVAACGVNRLDAWVRGGRYKSALPRIVGTDIAGEVAEVGPGVLRFHPGQKVVVYPSLSDGTCRYCLEGHPNRCLAGGLIGAVADGGYADYVAVPATNLVDAGRIDLKAAAATPVNFGTAWSALMGAGVSPGKGVLVWAAASGVGNAAVQVAKLMGATVIAVSGSKERADFAVSCGADHSIIRSKENVPIRTKELTGGQGVDFVFDPIGGETWATGIESLARGGRLISLGLTSGATSAVDVGRLYRNELGILGVFGYTKQDLVRVLSLVADGKLKPRTRELPLKSAKEAHEALESNSVEGKILLIP
jgi:NADPH:quinone reductase-like Zn-dependent oxidoreductase